MSVKQQLNVLGQMRVDTNHLKSIDSSNIKDFGLLLEAIATKTPYFLKGFKVQTATLDSEATSLLVDVADSVIWMPLESKGGFVHVPSTAPLQKLDPSINSKINGSFTTNAINYVAVRFKKTADSSTADLVTFFDIDSKQEFTKTVPTGLVLDYEFVINTTGFGDNTPLMKVDVSSTGMASTITNCKNSLFRLASGGDNPDINNETPVMTAENNLSASAISDPDPFTGGDWQIGSFKEWMDAVMSDLKRLKGSSYWYSNGSAISGVNLLDLWNDSIGSVITGQGRFINAGSGNLSWTSDINVNSIIGPRNYKVLASNAVLVDKEVAYIELGRNIDFQSVNNFTFVAGSDTITADAAISGISVNDWIKAVDHPESAWRQVLTVNPTTLVLTANYPLSGTALKAKKCDFIHSMQVALPENMPSNSNVFWIAKRDDLGFSPISISISTTSRSSDIVTITTGSAHNLVIGQSVAITGVTNPSFNVRAEIVDTPTINTFTFIQSGPDESSASGFIGQVSRIYLRNLGQLEDNESTQMGEDVPAELLQYIGSPTETSSAPNYQATTTGSLVYPNYNSVPGESLTERISKVTAMLSDNWQDLNIEINPGKITFDGIKISITGAYLSIPGSSVGAASVAITDISNITILNGECIYVDYSRTNGSSLTFSAATDLESLNPVQQRLIAVRRIGNEILIKPSSVYRQQTEVLYSADLHDPVNTTLPTGTSAVIDGITITNGKRVLFSSLTTSSDMVYEVSGVGVSLIWTPVPMFALGSTYPENAAIIVIKEGVAYKRQVGTFDLTYNQWYFNDAVRSFNIAGDFYEVSSIRSQILTLGGTSDVFTLPESTAVNLIVDYSLKRGTTVREVGSLYITHNGVDATVTASGSHIGTSGVSFDALIIGPDLVLRATSDMSGVSPELKYTVKQWSDNNGGVTGLPDYAPVTTLPTAVINTAYCMSDGSSLEVNCLPPTNPFGNTRIPLLFTYTVGMLPGTTSGDLEVYIDGKFIPRFVTGVTVDAYYIEIDNSTIELNADYSPVPVSVEVRKKYGAYDLSSSNAGLIAALQIDVADLTSDFNAFKSFVTSDMYDCVVGNAAQYSAGLATFTGLTLAIAATPSGKILVLKEYNLIEDITIDKTIMIEGQGKDTIIQGTVTFTSASDYSLVKNLRVTGNITFDAGSTGNIMTDCWQTAASTVTDNGTDNLYMITDV